jgi:RNA recognition motif-containing protein
MPFSTTEDDIHQYFGECGTIADLDFCTFPDTGKFNGICFITFKVSPDPCHRSEAERML